MPLDRVHVRSKPEVRLTARIEDWVSWVRSPEASSAIGAATRRFDAAHLAYARDGGAPGLRDLLAALTILEQAVGRSGRAREKAPVRRPPGAQEFLDVFAKAESESPELRIAVGIASCTTGPGVGQARTMRQILLPVDPAESAHPRGRWRDAPVVGGFGLRPLRQVLADVLAWRSRTAADESRAEAFHGVPTFRFGVETPAADLHAFARGQVDDAALEVWLRACLALSWRNVHHRWPVPGPVTLVPTLGLLHPLAAGLAPAHGSGDTTRLAQGPDWAVRLAAGQVTSVHTDAVRRLRQAGYQAVPALERPAADGISLAAALVPRCRGGLALLKEYFAIPIRADANVADPVENPEPDEQETNPRELAEEPS